MNKNDPKYTNSAGRLLAIMQNLLPNKPITGQLAPLLLQEAGPATNNSTEVSKIGVRAIAQLHILYSEFIEDMSTVDISEEQRTVLLSGLANLPRCIYPANLTANATILSDAEKSLLEVCATVLPMEGNLEKADIEDIQSSINELQKQIQRAETPPELKKILLELVRLSQDSINRFNIHGSQGLQKAFKGMLAEVAELYLRTSDEEKSAMTSNETWALITLHLRKFDAIAAKVLQYTPLLENTGKFFLGNN